MTRSGIPVKKIDVVINIVRFAHWIAYGEQDSGRFRCLANNPLSCLSRRGFAKTGRGTHSFRLVSAKLEERRRKKRLAVEASDVKSSAVPTLCLRLQRSQ